MAALAASAPPWIPEDDLLLKNAVEAGASLEALAKGAVRFSRKFTVGELRDRWLSLLYDPDVSAEASARMVEFELSASNFSSKFNKPGVSKETAQIPAKRKIESVRRMYYAMRKKTRGRVCDSPNLSLRGALDANDCIGFGGGCQENVGFDSQPPGGVLVSGDGNKNQFGCFRKGNYNETSSYAQDNLGKDSLAEFQKCTEIALPERIPSFYVEGILSQVPRVPLWKTIEDVPALEMPVNASVEGKSHGKEEALLHADDVDGNSVSLSGVNTIHSGAMLQDEHNVDILNNSTVISDSDLVDLPDSLLNFANEDEALSMDGKDTLDKSCYVNSPLVSSPSAVQDDVPNVKEPQTFASDTSVRIAASASPAELEAITKGSLPVDGNQCSHFCAEIITPSSTSAPNTSSGEPSDGEMECVLNTEDPEIPCNDHFSFTKKFTSSVMKTTSKVSRFLSSSCANQKDRKQELISMKKEDNPSQSLTASQMVGQAVLPVISPRHQLVSCGVKFESPGGICPAVISRQASNAHGNPSQCRSAQETPSSAPIGLLKAQSLHACNAKEVPLHAKASSPLETISVHEAGTSASNQEESESDDDVPSFSEIEAMVLAMDLCPDDSDSFINKEVSRYQNEDARRTIIRLEQCAESSRQRDIASRGAFAILFGRHLKHYIKETEVLLGRATDDMDVDIDLGREGPANKISRRQALIKMEGDGSFILKNLGKSPVFLNGKEVATGHTMRLISSSLIQIRELAFVFEINNKSVRQRLEHFAKNHQRNDFKFEWSEGVNHQDDNYQV